MTSRYKELEFDGVQWDWDKDWEYWPTLGEIEALVREGERLLC